MKSSKLPKRIHFVGIGGIGTSALALHLHNCGFIVSGSDRTASEVTNRLTESGIRVFIGHNRQNVVGAQAVVMTSAIPCGNQEVQYAKRCGIPVYLREQVLGKIFDEFPQRVAVCGTHGKTTVTAMISCIMSGCGFPHTAFIGGEYQGTNYVCRGSTAVVAEACEYNRSFLYLHPTVCVCLNAEYDHPDCYRDLAEVQAAFAEFFSNTEAGGTVVLPPNLQSLAEGKKLLTAGSGGDFCSKNVRYAKGKPSFDLYAFGKKVCRVRMNVLGKHNVNNALFALAAAYSAGLPLLPAAHVLHSFCGVGRRWTDCGGENYKVVCDYAHHPTEIRCSVQTAKSVARGKVICLFQPHTYSRTKALWQQFISCFSQASEVVYLPIFSAREEPIRQITSQNLCRAARRLGYNATYCADFDDAAEYVRKTANKGDVVLVLGAGDIVKIVDKLL